MGAVQGLIYFIVGLVVFPAIWVITEPGFDKIGDLCYGMGGKAAEGWTFLMAIRQAALVIIVFGMSIAAILSALGYKLNLRKRLG